MTSLTSRPAKRWRSRVPATRIPVYLVAVLLAVLAAFPFAFMVLASFKTQGEFLDNPFWLPQEVTLQNFGGLMTPQFGRYFLNSIVITGVSVVGTVVLGALAAYPLARMSFKLNPLLLVLFLAGMMVPIHVTLIPLYVLTQNLGLFDNIVALFGPFIAFNLPITIYIMVNFFRQVPESILSAAHIDGAGVWTVFRQILIPLSMPAISTVAIVNFIAIWNDFIFPLILLNDVANYPLPLGLSDFASQYRIDVPGTMAALVVSSIPTILFFFVAQEKVVSGLGAGALHGE